VVRELQSLTRLRLGSAKNLVEATHSMADFMELANAVEEYAMELNRVANDLRILASGPFTGLDEIRLPEVEPGSSIMPGKVNPSVPEMVNMVAFQVFGSVLAVRHAALGGQLDLNIFTPTIALSLPGALQLLTRATAIFTRRCVTGIRANVAACREYLDRSAGLATALTPVLGYDRAAELVKRAVAAGTSVREVLLRDSGLSAAELARRLEPGSLTRPNLRTWRPF
jgi:aspartate ammonia-lyase